MKPWEIERDFSFLRWGFQSALAYCGTFICLLILGDAVKGYALKPPDTLVWQGLAYSVMLLVILLFANPCQTRDRKSTRLNSSH